jgi:predicted nuclease with TOPRIM domain
MELKMEHRMTEVEARSKANEEKLELLEKRQDNLDELVGSVKVLATREERLEEDVKEIKGDVKSLTEKPAKRWDTMVEKVIWAVAAAVIAFLLAKLGL